MTDGDTDVAALAPSWIWGFEAEGQESERSGVSQALLDFRVHSVHLGQEAKLQTTFCTNIQGGQHQNTEKGAMSFSCYFESPKASVLKTGQGRTLAADKTLLLVSKRVKSNWGVSAYQSDPALVQRTGSKHRDTSFCYHKKPKGLSRSVTCRIRTQDGGTCYRWNSEEMLLKSFNKKGHWVFQHQGLVWDKGFLS